MTRIDRPDLYTVSGRHAKRIREQERTPGRWVYVGTYPGDPDTTPESPPFQNGWSNSGGGMAPMSFYLDKYRRVHLRGGVGGGSVGTTICTLPHAYRPAFSEQFVVAGDGTFSIIQVDPDGTVSQVS